jgi:DNA repair protein RecN (Recombination protein N)
VREGLAGLALGKAAFEVRVTPGATLRPEGLDEVEFFFSANPGEPPRALGKVASGGEASRLLLALKRALAGSDGCGSYVLDEADSGVSGAIADVVGRMIKEVSGHRQVLCITHLPQVAAYADAHLLIRKGHKAGRTVSEVVPLAAGTERTRELARMLSGVEVTREALGAAEALVRSAHRALGSTPRSRREPAPGGGARGRLRQSA